MVFTCSIYKTDKPKEESDKEEYHGIKRKRTKLNPARAHEIKDDRKRRKRKTKFHCEKCEKNFHTSTKLIAHCVIDHGMEHKDIKPFSCDR